MSRTVTKISTVTLIMILAYLMFRSVVLTRSMESGNDIAEVCIPIVKLNEDPKPVDEVTLSKYDALDPFVYEPANITSDQVRLITADMNYFDIVDVLGQTTSFGFGYIRLQYVIDDEYFLFIPYMRNWYEPFGLTGEDLLLQLTDRY